MNAEHYICSYRNKDKCLYPATAPSIKKGSHVNLAFKHSIPD